MTLNPLIRWVLGVLGLFLVGVGTALAWARPDAVSVVGFLAAGVVLLLAGVVPRLPTKAAFGGASVEWKEELVQQAYIAAFEQEAPYVAGAGVSPDQGIGYGLGFADVLKMARESENADELNRAVQFAMSIARERVRQARTGAIG